MSIPNFNESGDLPLGIHKATIATVAERFSFGSGQRVAITRRLLHIYRLAKQTGHLQHFIIFGSYVTSKVQPNDVDIILVMNDSFKLKDCPIESAETLRGLRAKGLIMRLRKLGMEPVFFGLVRSV